MGFLAVVNAYLMRVVLSVAITEMVMPLNKTIHDSSDTCPDPELTGTSKVGVAVSNIFILLSDTTVLMNVFAEL